MKRSLASQIWDRGRSNGCARNLAADGEKRSPVTDRGTPAGRDRAEGEEMKVRIPLIAKPEWTADEEEKLRLMLIKGEHPKVIGTVLNRSENAIRHRMTKLGLRSKRVRGLPFALATSGRMQALKDLVSAGKIGMKAKGEA